MIIVDFLVSVALFLIMFTVGLSIDILDLKEIFKKPKKIFLGSFLQLIYLPILAFVLVLIFDLPTPIELGILILSICPGGTTSNFISYLVKVNVPLSIALTSIGSIITLVTIPLFSNLFLIYFLGKGEIISLPVLKTIFNLLILIIVPVFIGMLWRNKKERSAIKVEGIMKYVSVGLLALVFLLKFLAKEGSGGSGITLESGLMVLPILLLLHVLALIGGFFIPKIFKVENKSATTIGIEVGLQNSALALFITGNLLNDPQMTHPILVYVLFSFFTTALFGYLLKRKNK